MSEQEFKIGDAVRLKGQRKPTMTVSYVGNDNKGRPYVRAMWIDEKNDRQSIAEAPEMFMFLEDDAALEEITYE